MSARPPSSRFRIRRPILRPRVSGAPDARVDDSRPRLVALSITAVLVALVAAGLAEMLTLLIGLLTNLAFHHRVSTTFASPAGNTLGLGVIGVPVVGGLVVGAMAKWGSPAIRGHGIPEAMENVLLNESRIPARMMILKPLSAAISIGTGGPFGAEGPIIATGGALGSIVGQLLPVTADERKTLLAAGAAAGMSATFGSPVAAVLLAVELLLFEYRRRSMIPVALAASAAAAARIAFVGPGPAFVVGALATPSGPSLLGYGLVGVVAGLVSVGVTRLVYAIEDAFEKLPIPWPLWPALGGIVVGVVGYVAPDTLGVGYANIEHIVTGSLAGGALVSLAVLKLVSWSVSLGSGTSGGTLAPLFTFGSATGALVGTELARAFPELGIDPRMAALVGMGALFAGASRALLASAVFAFETTRQTPGLLPLLAGCTAAYFLSSLLMRESIMTEKIVRRGVRVLGDYSADYLEQTSVRAVGLRPVVTVPSTWTLGALRAWVASGANGTSHQGYPVMRPDGRVLGVLTRRDLLDPSMPDDAVVATCLRRPLVATFEDQSLREAADLMSTEGVGRLPVLKRGSHELVGILTRSDLLAAHKPRLARARQVDRRMLQRFRRVPG